MVRPANSTFFNHGKTISINEVELDLHGLFWFHSQSIPTNSFYTHLVHPLIHNYPLTLAFMGLTVDESFVSKRRVIRRTVKHPDVWVKHGIYIYPALAEKMYHKNITMSVGGTGYVMVKPKTRAPMPDLTSNMIYVPGTIFKTYVITRGKKSIPRYIRVGSKRYGIFRVHLKRTVSVKPIVDNGLTPVSFPFNVKDVNPITSNNYMIHHAGTIAISGKAKYIVKIGDTVLALPPFVVGT